MNFIFIYASPNRISISYIEYIKFSVTSVVRVFFFLIMNKIETTFSFIHI